MKNTDWEILSVLYNTRSITRAAEKLYITQSALTKRIQAMEKEWGVEIVKRSSTGVTFTDNGKYLVRKANIMMDFNNEIREHFAESNTDKELLRIGLPNAFARLHMPELLKAYMNDFGCLQVKLVTNSSDVVLKQLMEGAIDIGIICGDFPYLGEKCRLFDENLYVVAPIGTTLDDIEHMPCIASYLNPVVRLTVEQWWKKHFGSPLHEEHFVPYSDIAIEMVDKGLGIAFLFGDRWRLNTDRLALLPIYDENDHAISRNVWMMLSERCYKSQDIMDFVSFVEKFYHVN
ncbi:MAG: LysR family transcriptional regulator [Coprococcus sp.]